MSATATSSYYLSKHAHICVTADTLFFLDEDTGKYLSVDKDQAASLSRFVHGWPLDSDRDTTPPLLQSLADRQLITLDSALGKSATPATADIPVAWLQDGLPRGCPTMRAKDIYRFTLAVTFALGNKKYRSFKKIMAAVQQRRGSSESRPVDLEQLGHLINVFDWLRPLAFKKTNECFLYCLALNDFLSKYGIHTTWVFAVQSQPFAAHCWLQYGDHALTDIPFNLRRMVPILVI